MNAVPFPEEILRILVRSFMFFFMFARLLSCVACVASAFAWAPCRACGWLVAGLCLFSAALWARVVRCFLALSGPIWRLLGRFGTLCDSVGALCLGLWCSWLVSCLACGACGRLVRACGWSVSVLCGALGARCEVLSGAFWTDLAPSGPIWHLV